MLTQPQLNRLNVLIREEEHSSFGAGIRQLLLSESAADEPDMQGAYETILGAISEWLLKMANGVEMQRKQERSGV
jgi:hypothetical protein